MTCTKTQGYLAQNRLEAKQVVNARSQRLGLDDVPALLKGVDQVYTCRGKKVERTAIGRTPPDRETLGRMFLGPTGNLRAPVLRSGRTLVVGFDPATYDEVLGR